MEFGKKIIAISFWDSYKCNFLSIFFGAGTKKRLEATDLYNKYKERRNEYNGFIFK